MSETLTTLEAENLSYKEIYYLFTSTIIPRPIALISTLSPTGVLNLAPFSSFNLVASKPACICFSIARKDDGTKKILL
jgi:flavin reductase (DIM6/NTAB) family NADH-FMN oxidoreductase RutF